MSRRGFAPILLIAAVALVIGCGLVAMYQFQGPHPAKAVPISLRSTSATEQGVPQTTTSTDGTTAPTSTTKPAITLIWPQGGEAFPLNGRNIDVRYRVTNYASLKDPAWRMELWRNGFKFGDRGILKVYADPSFWDFSWDPGTYYAQGTYKKAEPGYGYYLKIYLLDGNTVVSTDESTPFTLSPGPKQPLVPNLSVTYPKGNEMFTAASTVVITWTTPEPLETARFGIQITDENSASTVYTLKVCGGEPFTPPPLATEHSWTWNVRAPDLDGKTLTPSNYRLHIFNCNGSFGESNVFTITQ